MSEDVKPFDFIGYRELRAVLQKKTLLAEAREAIQQATRRYAKRQVTWFRKSRMYVGSQDSAMTRYTERCLRMASVGESGLRTAPCVSRRFGISSSFPLLFFFFFFLFLFLFFLFVLGLDG